MLEYYSNSGLVSQLLEGLKTEQARVHVEGLTASMPEVICAAVVEQMPTAGCLFIAPSKEDAYYAQGDIAALLGEERVMLFPTSYRKAYRYDPDQTDNANVVMRSEVVKRLAAGEPLVVVSYPEALAEKVVSTRILSAQTLRVARGEQVDMWQLVERLQEMEFERVDFVVEPGQYAVRGGIMDVFSYGNELPYRLEFFDDEVDSLRSFDAATQLSVKQLDRIDVLPNFDTRDASRVEVAEKVPLTAYFGRQDVVWVSALMHGLQTVEQLFADTEAEYLRRGSASEVSATLLPEPRSLMATTEDLLRPMLACRVVEYGSSRYFEKGTTVAAQSEPQPTFNKQFDLLHDNLRQLAERGYCLLVAVTNDQQQRRLEKIFDSWEAESRGIGVEVQLKQLNLAHGFVDHTTHLVCYTDHELFDRYHKYTVRDMRATREALTLKELFELKPGDFVTHIDYGVGRFSGLEKVEQNGRTQELIRLVYKGGDVLYISIHGLHKISRYVGREGEAPQLNKLGSNTWQVLKQRTKKQVKDIARDLIALYAKRKASVGFAFGVDTSMQEQLEASFLYEDTPDQLKATIAVKRDMEAQSPMDRLVCGDVGFGKTEVAIRAAFKACCDSKQVVVLVPSTILAFQHYNTFSERLREMPVRVDYLNRFRTAKEKTQIYKDVAEGRIDILIGTHAVTNKNLKFKDLGLMIVDEEQKFGVAVKEKLKQMRVGVDCLTLTATPIPRTLQFSLMGARDLSIIQTPPPNRQPIETTLADFDEELIRDAIAFEMSRGGQTFFVSNRVENLTEMAGLVQRLVPDARVAIAHGQMDGKEAEKTLMCFLEGEVDVLVATSIVENGLDIPGANTIIINNAQQFGLSDLHQMRGRVGRSNRKAFCYLLTPSYLTLTPDAQRRLKAIEEFSTIGSGFNIAMRDLDIRGAGNILGAEQSGFISEIGYDMYHKILNEAIEELKETDFRDLFAAEAQEKQAYVAECTLETDLEVLLPDDYVTNISERLLLYRQLSDLQTDQELELFRVQLADRFGPLPRPTEELIQTVVLRRLGKAFGIEKIVLKQGRMVCQLVSNQQSPFYQSGNFKRLIDYLQAHPTEARLKEDGNRLSFTLVNVQTVGQALAVLHTLEAK